MGFDREALQTAIKRHGRVARVVVAGIRGSSPREVGAAMLVWENGQSGTIGGGALEFQAAKAARLLPDGPSLSRHSLGPDLGQCCGGSVQLLTEIFNADTSSIFEDTDIVARPVETGSVMPLTVRRLISAARAMGQTPVSQLIDGWMIEPITHPSRHLWIWGAGHVGRAFVDVIAPLPDVAITWIDTELARFPDTIAQGVTHTATNNPVDLLPHAPRNAEHLIVTYSHALDLELCHGLLGHGFGFAGLIGSKSKWVRFRNRLEALGHITAQINRITCPIGDPTLGKHPHALAIGVATAFLQSKISNDKTKENFA